MEIPLLPVEEADKRVPTSSECYQNEDIAVSAKDGFLPHDDTATKTCN